jgi:hypothetical protein
MARRRLGGGLCLKIFLFVGHIKFFSNPIIQIPFDFFAVQIVEKKVRMKSRRALESVSKGGDLEWAPLNLTCRKSR